MSKKSSVLVLVVIIVMGSLVGARCCPVSVPVSAPVPVGTVTPGPVAAGVGRTGGTQMATNGSLDYVPGPVSNRTIEIAGRDMVILGCNTSVWNRGLYTGLCNLSQHLPVFTVNASVLRPIIEPYRDLIYFAIAFTISLPPNTTNTTPRVPPSVVYHSDSPTIIVLSGLNSTYFVEIVLWADGYRYLRGYYVLDDTGLEHRATDVIATAVEDLADMGKEPIGNIIRGVYLWDSDFGTGYYSGIWQSGDNKTVVEMARELHWQLEFDIELPRRVYDPSRGYYATVILPHTTIMSYTLSGELFDFFILIYPLGDGAPTVPGVIMVVAVATVSTAVVVAVVVAARRLYSRGR